MTTKTAVEIVRPKRVVTLPNGKKCSLGVYVASWRTLKSLPQDARVGGFDHFSEAPSLILRELRRGLHDRINRHDPAYGRGRKWDHDWQRQAIQTANNLNTPRLAINWLPMEFRERFAHRLSAAA